MKFEEALEEVKNGRGMRLPHWENDVVIRCFHPYEFGADIESIANAMCTVVAEIIQNDTTEDEDQFIKNELKRMLPVTMTHPFLYVESRYGTVPWKETVVEMFSSEWEIVD